jgi:hypothetical protein
MSERLALRQSSALNSPFTVLSPHDRGQPYPMSGLPPQPVDGPIGRGGTGTLEERAAGHSSLRAAQIRGGVL